jgi:hypothetical protein
MHPNAKLIERLYRALDRHDSETMAACYHPKARFRDIAFALDRQTDIADMWRMICTTDISAKFEIVSADEQSGAAKLVDEYTFSDTHRRVRNVIESRFTFQGGLIYTHEDTCDPKAWAAAALGGVTGFLAGRSRFMRAFAAWMKLRRFRRQMAKAAAGHHR